MKELVFKGEKNQVLTNSLIVAETFGKEHKRVMQDIRELGCSNGFQEHNFVLSFIIRELPNNGSKQDPYYVMTKDGFTLLAMSYTGDLAMNFKEGYIEAFNKMESELTTMKIPTTFREALLLAAEQQGVIEEQQKLIEMQSPKAEYFDNLVDRKLNINFRDTAKEIGIKESVFISFLLDKKYIYRDAKSKLKPIAAHVENGLFEIKEYSNDKHSGNQTLITPKGRETFRLILNNK